jgi:hypothetical protein
VKSLLAVVLGMAVPSTVVAGDSSFGVTYDGGTVSSIKAGTGIKMYMETNPGAFRTQQAGPGNGSCQMPSRRLAMANGPKI